MMTCAWRTALLLAGALAIVGCRQNATTPQTEIALPVALSEQVPERDIALLIKVKNALVNEPELKRFGLEVGVQGGIVTLYGEVATTAQRDKAERIAGSIRGVARVKSGISLAEPV